MIIINSKVRKALRIEMNERKSLQNVYRRQTPNKRSFRNPLKAVRKSERKKAGMGFHCPTRIGLLPALDSRHRGAQDEARPCAQDAHV